MRSAFKKDPEKRARHGLYVPNRMYGRSRSASGFVEPTAHGRDAVPLWLRASGAIILIVFTSSNDPVEIELVTRTISKLFEENNEAGKLDKAEEIVGVVFPANEDPALPLNPGEEALDESTAHVAA
jgi:hypothetical protein